VLSLPLQLVFPGQTLQLIHPEGMSVTTKKKRLIVLTPGCGRPAASTSGPQREWGEREVLWQSVDPPASSGDSSG